MLAETDREGKRGHFSGQAAGIKNRLAGGDLSPDVPAAAYAGNVV